MSQSILLAFRDDPPLGAHRAILQCAGYRTISAHNLAEAKNLSFERSPDLIILGNTFSDAEEADFIEEVHEYQPDMLVMCVKYNLIDPTMLLSACRSTFSRQPGSSRVRLLKAN